MDEIGGLIVIALIATPVWFMWHQHEEVVNLQTEVQQVTSENMDLKTADAHKCAVISDMDSEINAAKDYAWSDYETMGQELEMLETSDEIAVVVNPDYCNH